MPRATAKLFRNGRSQAVRLPKEFRMSGDEVYVERRGETLVLSPKDRPWAVFFSEVPLPTEDFLQTREDPPPQRREDFI